MTNAGPSSEHRTSGDGQTELFPVDAAAASARHRAAPPPPGPAAGREEAFATLLSHCAPVRAGSREAAWLKEQRIFRKTWLAQGLRVVTDYRSAANGLAARFTREALVSWGLFNREGHLRFYRHTLLVPWIDGGRPVHLQAFAIDAAAKPPVLAASGVPACPYNATALDGAPDRLYLCAGAIRALALLEAGFPAAATAEDGVLREEWAPRFRGKSVYVAFEGDAAKEAAATKAVSLLAARGIEAHRLVFPAPDSLPFA